MNSALRCAYGGEPDKGIELLRGLMANDTSNVSFAVNLGQVYLHLKKDSAMAKGIFEKVVLMDPDNTIANAGLRKIREGR
jgi:predicted Zn-dependent protease